MNVYDIFVVSILGVSLAIGLWKGFIKQVLALAGVIVGYFLSVSFYQQVALYLTGLDENVAQITSFLLILLASVIVFMILNVLFSKFIDAIGLSFFNHAGGGALGAVKGWLLVAVVSLVLVAFLPIGSPLLRDSMTLPYVMRSLESVKKAVPEDLRMKYFAKLQALQAYRFGDEVKKKSSEMLKQVKNVKL